MSQRKSIWITYAWNDNSDGDVDFCAQELVREGLVVKLDRWNLTAGRRLWEQIGDFIQDPSKSDGWLLYATQTSLGSEACKEEFFYAIDRALHTRGGDFPVIALFPTSVDTSLIPAGIRTRLFVSITDPDWKERIVAAVERRVSRITTPQVEPYFLKIHRWGEEPDNQSYVIEVRPRAGTWSPFLVGIPLNEKDEVSPQLIHGPSNQTSTSFACILFSQGEGPSQDGQLWLISAANEATPTHSYYVICKQLPSRLHFGQSGGAPQYEVTLGNR